MNLMRRIYYPYNKWEDWKAGMYNNNTTNEETLIMQSKELLIDDYLFYNVMLRVVTEWKHATELNLTNTSRNS